MDELTKKVGGIQRQLDASSCSLCMYKRNAEAKVGSGILEVKIALLQGQKRITHVTSEVNDFLESIEPQRLGEVSLRSQVHWLGENIKLVLADLDAADSSTTTTLTESMVFQASISDIGHGLAVQRRALDEARTQGDSLKITATQEYNRSVDLINDLQNQINTKAVQIRSQSTEASRLQNQLSSNQSQLNTLNSKLSYQQSKAAQKKEKAIGGGVSTEMHESVTYS